LGLLDELEPVSTGERTQCTRQHLNILSPFFNAVSASTAILRQVLIIARMNRPVACIAATAIIAMSAARAELPPVPVPPENPITESKRLLGKILFWDEQLSSDDTIACGTCHIPAVGGVDPREGIYPGTDAGTIDNVRGSPGIVGLDASGRTVEHPLFGFDPQVTQRASISNFMAIWADEIFWDGRARSTFRDPATGEVVIESGGALENQALMALSSDVEMAKQGRTWDELAEKLRTRPPLALASNWPPDIRRGLAANPDYPALFADAFGDTGITPVRIAFALATYQRTLVADRAPWDRFQAGESAALSARELRGWREFQAFLCADCHVPPLFTNNDFLNIGLRLWEFDVGRMGVTGDAEDAGEVKVPSLRNVGLRPRFMHTGQFSNLGAAIAFYTTGAALEGRDRMPRGGIYSFNMSSITETDIRAFLEGALTDPRVRDEVYPFDRPTLASEIQTH
jgi:cytochrome c peroxidase